MPEQRGETLEESAADTATLTWLVLTLLHSLSTLSEAAITEREDTLTTREAEVLRLVALGMTNAQVADRLFLSRRTVDHHLASIYSRLGVSSRAAATRLAILNHLC